MNNHDVRTHARWVRVLVLGVCACVAFSFLASSLTAFAAAPAHPAKIDPKCAGHNCDGTDPYATLCAGQPFDHEQVVGSAPITFAGQLFGMVQFWYSPLCRTTWARTMASISPLLLEATLLLPWGHFTTAAWGRNEVSSPQAFAPVALAGASGKILRDGRLASGCASLVPFLCVP